MRKDEENHHSLPEAPKRVVEERQKEDVVWYRNRKYQIGIAVVVIVFLFSLILGLALRKNGESGDWQNVSPPVQKIDNADLVKLSKERTFVAGTASNGDAYVEVFALNGKLEDTIQFQHQGNDKRQIEAMDVDKKGNHVAVALAVQGADEENDGASIEFHIYKYSNGAFTPHGTKIEPTELSDNSAGDVHYSNVMLSNNGKILAISFYQGSEGLVRVFKNAPGSSNAIGGVWEPQGETLTNLHDQDHGKFPTYTAMNGEGTKIAVAGEDELLALHENLNDGQHWNLTAELHEGPREDIGSLSMSNDGTTWASGAYSEDGELWVQNEYWPMKLKTEHPNTSVQVSLSADGKRVLVGRYPLDGGEASLQVYHFYENYENVWVNLGEVFNRENNIAGQSGAVDLSDDGNKAAAIVNGRVRIYQYTGEADPFPGV